MPQEDNPPGTLCERTRQLLQEDKRSALAIHKESGISFYWLRKFKSGVTTDPSVNTIQALYEFLTGSKLQLK